MFRSQHAWQLISVRFFGEQGPAFYGLTIETKPSLSLEFNAKPVLDDILKELPGAVLLREDSEDVLECQEGPDFQSEMYLLHSIFASFSNG